MKVIMAHIAKLEAGQVKQITTQVDKPGRKYPHGRVAFGYYTVTDDNLLTMTDAAGKPAEDETGRRYTHMLGPNDDPRAIAARLTRELRKAFRGSEAPKAGFEGKIPYRKLGLA
jgi:hypothetical protein